ncbi:MAG: hypothetical protein WBO45_14155, partial [Planctomycetota bacterium]
MEALPFLLFLLALPGVVLWVTVLVLRDLVRTLRTAERPCPQRPGFLVAALVVLLADLAAIAAVCFWPRPAGDLGTPGLVLVTWVGLCAVAALGKALHLFATPRATRTPEAVDWPWIL